MADPTPDEAAAALQAVLDVLDAGGRHCGCDPDLYGDGDFIGFVSDANGRDHHEVRAQSIRTLLAERTQLLHALRHPCDGEACESGGAAHCHRCAEAEADKLLAERDQLRATIDRVRTIHHRAECANARCALGGWCIGCDPNGDEPCSEHPWPCPTVLALDADAKLPDQYAAWVLKRDHDKVTAQNQRLREDLDLLRAYAAEAAPAIQSLWSSSTRLLAPMLPDVERILGPQNDDSAGSGA